MTRITDSSDSGYGGISGNSNRGVSNNAIDGSGNRIILRSIFVDSLTSHFTEFCRPNYGNS